MLFFLEGRVMILIYFKQILKTFMASEYLFSRTLQVKIKTKKSKIQKRKYFISIL